ncbi:hypothetical protein V3C99_018517 [Haemonchus contortus]
MFDEGQPCKQAGLQRGFSTIDQIHIVTRLIEVSREYKMPLCLTFIDLKKSTVETEAVIEDLGNQGVPTYYVRTLRELFINFTTRISPFYGEVIINMEWWARQGDIISPKLYTAAQAQRVLAEFNGAYVNIGLKRNLRKAIFMRNGIALDAFFTLNGMNTSEFSGHTHLGRGVNMKNDLAMKLSRRKRAAWEAFKNIEGVVKKTKSIRLRPHSFDIAVLPALTCALETWTLRKHDEHAVNDS